MVSTKGAPNPETYSALRCHAPKGAPNPESYSADRGIHEGRSESGDLFGHQEAYELRHKNEKLLHYSRVCTSTKPTNRVIGKIFVDALNSKAVAGFFLTCPRVDLPLFLQWSLLDRGRPSSDPAFRRPVSGRLEVLSSGPALLECNGATELVDCTT